MENYPEYIIPSPISISSKLIYKWNNENKQKQDTLIIYTAYNLNPRKRNINQNNLFPKNTKKKANSLTFEM